MSGDSGVKELSTDSRTMVDYNQGGFTNKTALNGPFFRVELILARIQPLVCCISVAAIRVVNQSE